MEAAELRGKLGEALGLLWNSELERSTAAFSRISACDPGDDIECANLIAEAHLRQAQAAWLQAILSEVKSDVKEAKERLKEAGNRLKFRKVSDNIPVASLYAESVLMRSLLQLRTGDYIRGAFNLRKGWKLYEAIQAEVGDQCLTRKKASSSRSGDHETGGCDQPEESGEAEGGGIDRDTLMRIKFGTATFNFFVSIVPPSLLFIVECLGFRADRSGGYEALQAVLEADVSVSPAAGIILLWIETFFMENFEKAAEISARCLAQYPRNMVVVYLTGYLERQQYNLERALELFTVAGGYAKEIRQFRTACLYEQADCYWRLMEWEKAVEFFVAFNEANVSKSFQCYAAYQHGVALCFLGREEEALVCFRNSTKWARKYFSFDAYAARKSSEFLKAKGMSQAEMDLVQANCLRRQGKAKEAIALLKEKTHEGAPDVAACNFYLLGRAKKEAGDLKGAEVSFKQCIDLEAKVTREKYTLPHCYLELAMMKLNAGEVDPALFLLGEARKYNNYDFDKPNIRRIMRAIDRANSA